MLPYRTIPSPEEPLICVFLNLKQVCVSKELWAMFVNFSFEI